MCGLILVPRERVVPRDQVLGQARRRRSRGANAHTEEVRDETSVEVLRSLVGGFCSVLENKRPATVNLLKCEQSKWIDTTGVRLLGLIRPTGAVERGLPTSNNTKEQHSRPEALLLTSNTNSSAGAYCFLPLCLVQSLSYLNLLDERGTTEG